MDAPVPFSAGASSPPAIVAPAPDAEPPYVYAATDIRPRQTKEIALCERASHFAWEYTGAFALGFATSIYLNLGYLKHENDRAVRMLGPGLVGFTWGGVLMGGFLSLPKCDPLWAEGAPPEGNVRTLWPVALAIGAAAAISAPFMDYSFLGPVKQHWEVWERSMRIFVAGGSAVLGSIFPYILPPRTWAARKELDRIRIEGQPTGATVSYTLRF